MTPAEFVILAGTQYFRWRRDAIAVANRNTAAGNATTLLFAGSAADIQGFAWSDLAVTQAVPNGAVALISDRAQSYGVGPEMAAAFGAGWTGPINGASFAAGAMAFDGVTSIASGTEYTTGPACVSGKTYRVGYTIVGNTTRFISVGIGASVAGTPKEAVGAYAELLKATSSVPVGVYARSTAGARTGSISSPSVKEIPGYPAIQLTSANQPLLVQNAAGFFDYIFDASNDAVTVNLPSGGTPSVVSFADTGEITGYDSATTTTAVLGQTTLAGKKVGLIVASASALAADDLAAIRRFAGLLRGTVY